MGLFGFLEKAITASIKTVVVAPLAVASDVVNLEPFEKTGAIIESIADNVSDGLGELFD